MKNNRFNINIQNANRLCFLFFNQRRKIFFSFLFFLSSFFYCYSQLYPVQVNQNLIPPYNTKLSTYVTTSDTKLNLQLLLRDINVTNRQVKLKLYIQGNGFNVQSAPVVIGAPMIFLDGGVPQFFTNVDLKAYFELNNLVGITPQQYSQSLPDGVYQICWEVYDFITNQLISQKSCLPVYLLLNDPPFLNLPQRAENITQQDPTNIIFQWTPRHVNATNVSYEFELREIWDNQIDPQAAFLASPNYYSETTYSTTLLYNISKPTLIPSKRYAWRVRAVSTSGISENSVFKNNGYSEIFYFTYSNDCASPIYPLSEALSPQKVKLTWQGQPDHNKYHVQYKKANVDEADWFEVFTYNTQALISNLEPGATYDFRVGGTCNPVTDLEPSYTYSNINQFTMPTEDEAVSYNCGVMPEIDITNTSPLGSLGVNETFTAGDFPVTVKEIQGGNGIFSGHGFIVVPYLADTKIAVEFTGIKINTDYQMFDGIIKTTYDPTWGGVSDVDDLFGGGPGGGQEITIDFPISLPDGIQIDPNGDIIIVGPDGQTVELPGGEDYVITDSEGNQFAIDEDGNITELGQEAEGGKPSPENTDGVNDNGEATDITAEGILVTFTKANDNKFGFDTYNPSQNETIELYKRLGNDYYIPYKSVKNGDEDYIIANIDISDSSIVADSLIFKTQDGTAIEVQEKNGTQWKLKVKGYQKDAVKDIFATIKQGDKYQVAGAFKLYHLEEKEVDIVLVNTNNANKQAIEDKLNEVYKQAVVKVNIVQEITDFTITPNADGKIDSGESGFVANYTEQQQSINQSLRDRQDYKPNAYYLITTDLTPTESEEGFMPLGRQFGYIYSNSNISHTISHEIGHGAFKLKHPFSPNSYGWEEKSTDWLIDYKGGEHLPYIQWQEIHNPRLRIGIFDSDAEGEYKAWTHVEGRMIESIPGYENQIKGFFTHVGKIVSLPANARDFTVNDNGALSGFTIGEERYIALFKKNEAQNFSGYFKDAIQTSEDTYSINNANAYTFSSIKPDYVFYTKYAGYCSIVNIYKANYSEDLFSQDGGIEISYRDNNPSITEHELITNHAEIAQVVEYNNCLEGKVKEFYKFVIEHYTSEGYEEIVNSDYKYELAKALYKYQNVYIKEVDELPNEGAITQVSFEEMMNYGAEELLYDLKEPLEDFEEGQKTNAILVIELQEFEKYKDEYLLYTYLKEKTVDANCTILEQLEGVEPEFSFAFFKTVADAGYELISGNEVIELLSCALEHIKIPESFWNPNRIDNDTHKAIELVLERIGLNPESLANDIAEGSVEYPLACGCGVYNSLIDILLGITTLPDFITTDPVQQYNDIDQFFENFDFGTIRSEIWTMLQEHHGYYDTTIDSYQATYGVCYDALFVLSLYAGVGEVKALATAAKLGDLSEVGRIVVNVIRTAPTKTASTVRALTYIPKVTNLASKRALLYLVEHAPEVIVKTLPNDTKTFIIASALEIEVARFTPTGVLLTKPGQVKNIIYESAEDVPFQNAEDARLVIGYDDAGELVASARTVVNQAGRFIAKTGTELRNHLSTIVKPTGKTYTGDVYRSLSKTSETNFGALPNEMTDHHIYSSWGRYDLPGEENAMYLSKSLTGNQTELVPHYGAWADFSTYKYANVKADNMLDLTDDVIRQQLGVDFPQLTKVLDDKAVMYEFTNELSKWARQNGYNGLIVPGARGAKDYQNVIIFNQSYVNQVLQGKTAIPISK